MTGNGLTGQTSGIRDGRTDVSSPLSIPGKKTNLKHKIIFSLNDASVSEPDNQGNSKDCVMISGENGTWSDYAWYLSSFYKVK